MSFFSFLITVHLSKVICIYFRKPVTELDVIVEIENVTLNNTQLTEMFNINSVHKLQSYFPSAIIQPETKELQSNTPNSSVIAEFFA